jgi:peptidyl-prolyl cis-trans isomerase SurA
MADPSGTTYSFKKAKDLVPSRLKTLQEARGYIVADYQDYLEKQWLDSLNKEFNVVIYHEVLNALKK